LEDRSPDDIRKEQYEPLEKAVEDDYARLRDLEKAVEKIENYSYDDSERLRDLEDRSRDDIQYEPLEKAVGKLQSDSYDDNERLHYLERELDKLKRARDDIRQEQYGLGKVHERNSTTIDELRAETKREMNSTQASGPPAFKGLHKTVPKDKGSAKRLAKSVRKDKGSTSCPAK